MSGVTVPSSLARRSVAASWARASSPLLLTSNDPADLWEVAPGPKRDCEVHAYSAGYQVQKLLDDICDSPPNVKSVAQMLAYVHGQHLTVADKGSRGENLLRIAKQLMLQTPQTYGLPREAAVAEMRFRLVTRALRALVQAHRGVIIWGTVDKLWVTMRKQKRLFRRGFARNAAAEFKVHEAASMLASLPNTQTRWDRCGRKLMDVVLLAAAIASTFLPFLALGPARNAVGNVATSFGNASGATGMVAVDLAVDLCSPKPRPAPWHKTYDKLRGRFETFKLARKQQSPDADAKEIDFSRKLSAYHPDNKHLWRAWGFEFPWNRRIFMLGVLDLTDRFIRRAQRLENVARLMPTVRRMLKSKKPTWHERAIEVLLTLEAHMPRLTALHGGRGQSRACVTCEGLLDQMQNERGFKEARQRWLSRAELGEVLQTEGHNGGIH